MFSLKTATKVATSTHSRTFSTFVHKKLPTRAKKNKSEFNAKGHKILSAAEIAEIRRLRETAPEQWGQYRLAKKFSCSRLMIAMHAPATAQRQRIAKKKIQLEAEIKEQAQPHARKAKRKQWFDRIQKQEHQAWQEKLAQKEANKAARGVSRR